MRDIAEVENFLNEFITNLNIYGILYADSRQKNTQALAELNIVPNDRTKLISELKVEDYCLGPETDHSYFDQTIWIFGKMIKGKEIYIKISMGTLNSRVICISFHPSKSPLNYPFK